MCMQSDGSFKLSCYVNSDFGGPFRSKDPGNPVSVKPRTGYLIKFGSVPIIWVSKLETQIALSPSTEEYTALSQSKHDLIPLWEKVQKIYIKVLKKDYPKMFGLTPKCCL